MNFPDNLPIPIPTEVQTPWGLAAFIIAVLVGWATYRQNRVDRRIGNVEGQVVNCHNDEPGAPTMRDDIDRANGRLDDLTEKVHHLMMLVERLANVPEMVQGLMADVRQVRRDQTVDREEILALRQPPNGK